MNFHVKKSHYLIFNKRGAFLLKIQCYFTALRLKSIFSAEWVRAPAEI